MFIIIVTRVDTYTVSKHHNGPLILLVPFPAAVAYQSRYRGFHRRPEIKNLEVYTVPIHGTRYLYIITYRYFHIMTIIICYN